MKYFIGLFLFCSTAFAGSIATQAITGTVAVSNFPATQPVSISGVATESTLSSMSSKFPSSLGQKTMASSLSCSMASDQSGIPVTGSFYPATQPVSGTFWQATQPVSGTFWQATQPISGAVSGTGTFTVSGTVTANAGTGTFAVSAASLPLPSGASTSAKQPALGTAGTASSDVLTVQGIASMTALKVDGSGITQPISGTLAATQSGTWTVQPGNTANTTAWKVDGSAVTQPVSGTFWQATQPVSFTQPALVAGTAVIGKTGIDQTTPGTTNGVQVNAALPAGANKIGTVDIATAAATAKATQGANGVPTQDLKDAGRSARTIFLDSFAVAATAETLMTMSYSTDNGTATTGTSYNVTAGKRLRIQQILVSLHTIAGNTTAVTVIVRVRVNNGGAGIVTSPIQMVVPVQGVAAANQAGIPVDIPIPDGWEFVAGAGIAVTVACPGFVATTAAPKVDISITAYEY
jgi:hypothetical protein